MLEFIAAVSGENLVRAVARQCDRHGFAGELADAPCRKGRGIGKGLVEHPRDGIRSGVIVRRNSAAAVVRGEPLGDFGGVTGFVVSGAVKPDRTGLDGLRRRLRHEGNDSGRIDAPRQERAQWHVGNHP